MAEIPYRSDPAIHMAGEERYEQDDVDREDCALVLRLREIGKHHRELYAKDWDKYRRFKNGKQWDQKRPRYRASPVINVIRPIIQTTEPILTDTRPGINITPREPQDHEFAENVQQLLPTWWKRRDMDLTLLDGLDDGLTYGLGVFKVVWDQNVENGAGDAHVVSVDPSKIGVPMGARGFQVKCPWVTEDLEISVAKLKQKFPDKAHLIKADTKTDSKKKDSASKYDTEVTVVSPIDKHYNLPDQEGRGKPTEDEQTAAVCECWIDDSAVIEEDDTNENGDVIIGDDNNPVKKVRKKYPNGKLVIVLVNQKVVLYSGDNPYRDGLKPYVRFVPTIKSREFCGEGEIEPLIEIQKMINKVHATIQDWLNNMSNPVWIIDSNSGVEPDELTNQIGLVIEKLHGTIVTREDPPGLPNYIFKYLDNLMTIVDQVSGIHDVTQGRRPSGVTAAEAIYELQEAAQTRLRLKERNLQAMMTQMGYLIVSRMLQFYREPRVAKITGKKQWPEFFEYQIEDIENGNYKFTRRNYIYDDRTSQYQLSNKTHSAESKGLFDIEVVAGSAMPYLKAQRGSVAFRLFEAGVLDEKALLDAVEWPNKEEVLQRLEKRQAMAQAPEQGVVA